MHADICSIGHKGHQLPEEQPCPALSIGLGMSHTQTKGLQHRTVVLSAERTQRDPGRAVLGYHSHTPKSYPLFSRMTFKGHRHAREKPFPLGSPPPPHPTHLLTLLVTYGSSRLGLSHMLDLAWPGLTTALLGLIFSKCENFKLADDI